LRFKLEGNENDWHASEAAMGLTVRFCDEQGDQVGQAIFEARGESPGWNCTLTSSPLTHRRETLLVPPSASRLWVTVSSGCGPPATVGIYAVDNLIVSRVSPTNGAPEVLLQPSFDGDTGDSAADSPRGWLRDGIRPSMARIIELGSEPKARALAILDDDPLGHAEWHNRRDTAPRIVPGERLVLEWNELFSMGLGITRLASYSKLPPGDFVFRVEEVSILGLPTGIADSVRVHVPLPLWEMPLFWPAILSTLLAASVGGARYVSWYRMRKEVLRLKQQRALEQERIRIAQDIHDDLGARVTQISLLSAMAQGNPGLPEKARADFDHISRMTRELVSALYETVWAVDPENDNLDALGNYLCQMVNQLCSQASLRCRFDVVDLPKEIQVSSQTRHSISMAVKEAVHNVIKHARASEVKLCVGFVEGALNISVSDNGCGFNSFEHSAGSGLQNMKRRLEAIGGSCEIKSQAGQGTSVQMRLVLA
jgi:signal transduction histidine kinase